jgi:hypothetical protein
VLAIIPVLGSRAPGPAGCTGNTQAQQRKDLFSGYESSERAKFFHRQPRSIHEADQRLSGSRSCQITRHIASKKTPMFGG